MRKGFTLLELSIVLVIIGLIIGGITAGADLIRSAEINSVGNDITKYKVAINTFKLKYNALPGDIKNAQSYWPSCIDNGTNLCNGNGNGTLGDNAEGARFWQHLSLSGLISGNYIGFQTTGGENLPDLLNNRLQVYYLTVHDDKTGVEQTVNSNYFFQAFDETDIKELEMSQLDIKFDDGLPESGEYIMWLQGFDSKCLTATSPAEYDFSASGNYEECYPSFLF